MRLKDLAATRVRHGDRRLHSLLRHEGWNMNAKRGDRLYRKEPLRRRTKTPKRRASCRTHVERPEATRINDCWVMDYMTDELFDGRRFRLLTIVDHLLGESPSIGVGQPRPCRDATDVLTRIDHEQSPETIRVDNRLEFSSKTWSNGRVRTM